MNNSSPLMLLFLTLAVVCHSQIVNHSHYASAKNAGDRALEVRERVNRDADEDKDPGTAGGRKRKAGIHGDSYQAPWLPTQDPHYPWWLRTTVTIDPDIIPLALNSEEEDKKN